MATRLLPDESASPSSIRMEMLNKAQDDSAGWAGGMSRLIDEPPIQSQPLRRFAQQWGQGHQRRHAIDSAAWRASCAVDGRPPKEPAVPAYRTALCTRNARHSREPIPLVER
jgi:hypothetical protein